MKSLAFLCSLLLLALSCRAEPTTAPASPGVGAGAPNWAAAIDKFGKDSPDASQDAADAKLFADHTSEEERFAKSAAARAARAALAPSLRASEALATASAPVAAKTAVAQAVSIDDKKDDDEDWAGTVRQSIKDIVRPYQELLPGGDSAAKAARDASGEGGERRQDGASGQTYGSKSEQQREREKIRSDVLLDQLLEELKPWAIGAVVVLFLGLGLSQWLTYMQRKSAAPSSRQRSSKKKRRRGAL